MTRPLVQSVSPNGMCRAPGGISLGFRNKRVLDVESRDIVHRVEREIERLMSQPGAAPTLDGIAFSLGLHVRTLQRRLGRQDVAFRELLDICRRRRAISEVGAREHDLATIAARLGYSDAAHFSRAFRRWTGLSPMAYRKAMERRPRQPNNVD